MESLALTATHTLREMLARQPLTPAKVAFAWKVAAGPALARAAAAAWTTDGTLRLTVGDPAWKPEVERAAPIVQDRLAFLLGRGVVRGIVVAVTR